MAELPERIVLIGPSGSGKSEVALLLAERLGFSAVDTDAEIVRRIDMPIASFFARFGEPAFRALEAQVLREACATPRVVIATGGGAVLAPANWTFLRPGSVIVGLTARPDTLVARVRAQAEREGDVAERPLLAGDPVAKMRALLDARAELYAGADVTVDTDERDSDEVCAAALAAVAELARAGRVPLLSLGGATERSDIFVDHGLLEAAPAVARQRWPRARAVWVVTDEHVGAFWRDAVDAAFSSAGFVVRRLDVAPGEATKRMGEVERLCDEMTRGGVTRRDLVVALGGGVVGDLAGFVAAVCLRGLPLLQLPTSLLAMVDSSVGGKTGVNLPAGKNLVGAFYQPGVVLIDPRFLDTLPRAEYRSGMAEVVKHALIQPAAPLGGTSLRDQLDALPLDPLPAERVTEVLGLNVRIKHAVVQADEREAGLRMILNFGHTAGHAIEADGYRYRHGEAVALGLVVAARLSRLQERVDDAYVSGVERLLARAGLPTRVEARIDDVVDRLARDKKNVDGALHWVLPNRSGVVERVTGIPLEMVRIALAETGAT